MVAEFKANRTGGRDLVFGDIHGCGATVEHALEALGYDPARDRLFSLGDLIDHGPRSEDALEWITSRFTATVRGNHEQMLIDWLQTGGRGARFGTVAAAWAMDPGSAWWREKERPQQEREAWLAALSGLPFAVTVHTANGRVGLIHAQGPVPRRSVLQILDDQPLAPETAPLDWDTLCEALAQADGITRTERLSTAAEESLWRRPETGSSERGENLPPGIDGVALVLHGHHAALEPRWTATKMVCIDTGVHIEEYGHLTVAEIQTGKPKLHRFARIDTMLEPTAL